MIGRTNAAVGTIKNPYIAKSESEMAKYCDAKYAGAFVKFLDPAYNFSVPKTFRSHLYIPGKPQKTTEVLNFSFDWTRDRQEVLSLVQEILNSHNSDKVKILHMTTTETPKVFEFYVQKGVNPDTTAAYAVMLVNPQGFGDDTTPHVTPLWAYNIKVGCSIGTDVIEAPEGETLWSQETIDNFYNENNINGWGGVKLGSKLGEGIGITTYMTYAFFGGATDRVITVTEYLPEATPLFMIADHSQAYKHAHIYQVIKSDKVVSKYVAASPLAIGDALAGATIKLNTEMSYDQVMDLMYQIPWNEAFIQSYDGTAYYYCIFNNAPDIGYSTYTGEKFDESEQFGKAAGGIIFIKFATDNYTDYAILHGEGPIWVNDHEHFGGDTDGWQVTQVTIPTTIEGYNITQDATITRINTQNIINQLFSKTTFTVLSSTFKYEAMRYNRDGYPTCFCSPVGDYVDVNVDEANKILQDNRNLGKIYRYSGASESGNYHVGDYYIVEEVIE